MTPGIFISYSREDEKQAMHLLALLRREGYSVWIDQEAIAGASIWSDEIVQNIKTSEIFIALLSASSVASANVAKEIALAAEHGKIILPIEIGSVSLPGRLEYALAGIQKTNFQDEEAIIRAVRSQVSKLEGIEASASPAQSVRSQIRQHRARITAGVFGTVVIALSLFFILHHTPDPPVALNSIAVLPFATLNLDLDSTRNLDIFSESLLTRIAALKTLTPISTAATSSYKDSRLNALAIAQELKARFIIEGVVRKIHDVNFISSRVIDTKKGGEVWEQSYSGNNSELFAIRERLTSDLTGFLRDMTGNEFLVANAEANLKLHPNDAAANAALATLLIATDKNRSIDLFEHAIKLDSGNIAYYVSAGIASERAGIDGRDFGRHAVAICKQRLLLYPDSSDLKGAYAIALDLAGLGTQAEEVFNTLLPSNPKNVRMNYNAACCFAKQGKADTAVSILEHLFTFAPGKRGEVKSDPDFDGIRSSPQYQKLMYGTP